MGSIAPGSSPPLPAFAIPDERSWLLVPAPRRLLKPASDLVWAVRVLPVQRAALEHALDRLGHVEPAAAHRRVERHDPLGSSGRRNTLREEVAMAIRKQRSDRSG